MAEAIRVLHFIPGFLFGGIESTFLAFFSRADKEKIRVELLLRTQDDDIETLRRYREMGGTYYRLCELNPKEMLRYIRSVREFFRLHHDYDILHAHGADPFVFYYAKKCGIRRIVLHSHTTADSKGEKFPLMKRCLKNAALASVTDRFACSHQAGARLFGKKAVKNNQVTIIRNAIDIWKYVYNPKTRNEYRHTLGLEGRYVLGHVGRMTYAKNYPFLLDVFTRIAGMREDAVLLLVGDGPDLQSIRKRIKELGLENRVKLLGFRHDVPALLQAMDVLLLPSHFEGLPVIVVEAQAAGLPCVVSEGIAEESEYTDLVTRLSLGETPEKWAETALSRDTSGRHSDLSAIRASGYELDSEVKRLEGIYMAMLPTHQTKRGARRP